MSKCSRCKCKGDDPFAWLHSGPPVTAFATEPATVLTLAPEGYELSSRHLKGELFVAPNYLVKVPYTNVANSTNVTAGMNALDSLLLSTGGKVIVVGHDLGARVIYKWLRDKGPTSTVDAANVQFVCTGNPERKYNSHTADLTSFGGFGCPAGTPYQVIDFVRQYDFWGDYPNDTGNDWATKNVGWLLFPGTWTDIHFNYTGVGLNDARNRRVTEGNITYVWSPTYPLPLKDVRVTAWWPDLHRKMEAKYRPLVEAGYSRPVSIPLTI